MNHDQTDHHQTDDRSTKVPCAAQPSAWDLDAGQLGQWLQAIRTCLDCPVLQQCSRLRDQLYPQGNPSRPTTGNPRSVIWAAVPYSEVGAPMTPTSLRRYARRTGRAGAPERDRRTIGLR